MKVYWMCLFAVLLEGYHLIRFDLSAILRQVDLEDQALTAPPILNVTASPITPLPPKPLNVPVLIISSLRADYLQKVMDAIAPQNQNPNTPSWIGNSTRYVFAHKNVHTDKDSRWNDTQAVAKAHNYQMHVFEGLTTEDLKHTPPNPKLAYHTKHTWYRMMRHLFHTLNETEVLILEDDAVLAPDGLLTAAVLLQHKQTRNDIHTIALGGHAGSNKVNADPEHYLAVRSRYFQAMAYSMNVTIFDQLDEKFQQVHNALQFMSPKQLEEENYIGFSDWTMEITERSFLSELVQLEPSVGRMHHIGLQGMGYDGNGKKHQPFPVPWENWNLTQTNRQRMLERRVEDFVLYPTNVTDDWGFVCDPATYKGIAHCPGFSTPKDAYGYNKVRIRFSDQLAKQQAYIQQKVSDSKNRHAYGTATKKENKQPQHHKKDNKKQNMKYNRNGHSTAKPETKTTFQERKPKSNLFTLADFMAKQEKDKAEGKTTEENDATAKGKLREAWLASVKLDRNDRATKMESATPSWHETKVQPIEQEKAPVKASAREMQAFVEKRQQKRARRVKKKDT